MSSVDLSLVLAPHLPGARCVGQHDEFDVFDDDDIVEACQFVCKRCPALQACEDYIDGLKPSQRPFGVVAGQVRRPRGRRAAA